MSKKRKNAKVCTDNVQVMDATKVRIANGAGKQPIIVDYVQGETYAQLFKRTGITLDEKHIATIGKGPIKDLSRPVEAGTTITIANTPSNG